MARDIVQELVPNLAREAAIQAARSISEDLDGGPLMPQYGLRRRPLNRLPLKSLAALPSALPALPPKKALVLSLEEAAREVSEGVATAVARGLKLTGTNCAMNRNPGAAPDA